MPGGIASSLAGLSHRQGWIVVGVDATPPPAIAATRPRTWNGVQPVDSQG
jgi:hypothetical protein